jgi:hypothetical protein
MDPINEIIENNHNTIGNVRMVPINTQKVLSDGVNFSHFSISVMPESGIQENPCIVRRPSFDIRIDMLSSPIFTLN